MKHPEKWRDTINPLELKMSNFKIENILGYPHAGNDVFHVEGIFENKPCRAFIKVERQLGADVSKEIEIINKLEYAQKPEILDFSLETPAFIVTKEVVGERLSTLFNENPNLCSSSFMELYGMELAKLHTSNVSCDDVKHRRFFDMPSEDYFMEHNLQEASVFLQTYMPKNTNKCFVHGDFHYANVLWHENKISAVLDYELSGVGVREFDIAWSVFLRPSQKFLKTYDEIKLFLSGYGKSQAYSFSSFLYYYVLIACHFYTHGDEEYEEDVRRLIMDSVNLMNNEENF